MKSPLSQIHSAAVFPSPVFLLTLKVLLFMIWGFSCCKIGWDSAMRMSADLRNLFLYEAFLYYNPPLLMTLMVWLWGVNLWVFSQANIGYAKIFDLDQNHLTHKEVWKCSTWMTIIVPTSMTAYLYLYSHGKLLLAALLPVSLYIAVAIVLISPFDIFYLSSRYFLLRTLCRIALPVQAISFPDFFVAEVLTSMSKVFSDLERSVCRMVHGLVATIAWLEADSVCGSHSIGIPLVLVFPYGCRLFQCLRQYKDTKDKTNLFNGGQTFYEPLWLLSSIVNSLYSFYWDIAQDWDLSGFTRIFKFSRPSLVSYLLYGQKWVYFWAIGSNLILRCAWTYKFSAHLRHNYMTVFAITALEILRRFQWVFFRVENEWNKINKSSYDPLPMTIIQTEEETLLDANSHSV